MRNTTKRKYGTLIFTSVLLFFGHWWDFFLMIKPGTLETAEHVAHMHAESSDHGDHAAHAASSFIEGFTIPGLLEIGTFIGFLCLFLFVAYSQLAKADLIPLNDPYLEESTHHEVQQDLSGAGGHH
jgi:hypothetical protein